MDNLQTLHILTALLVFILKVEGYGTGAPASDEICKTMLPNHGASAQTTSPPYNISISNETPSRGQTVQITLSGPSKPFKGFLAMMKDSADGKISYGKFGNFTLPTDNAKAISCFGNKFSAVTHTNNKDKNKVNLYWTAPDDQINRKLTLVVTFVQNMQTIWKAVAYPKKITVTGKQQG